MCSLTPRWGSRGLVCLLSLVCLVIWLLDGLLGVTVPIHLSKPSLSDQPRLEQCLVNCRHYTVLNRWSSRLITFLSCLVSVYVHFWTWVDSINLVAKELLLWSFCLHTELHLVLGFSQVIHVEVVVRACEDVWFVHGHFGSTTVWLVRCSHVCSHSVMVALMLKRLQLDRNFTILETVWPVARASQLLEHVHRLKWVFKLQACWVRWPHRGFDTVHRWG